MIDKTLLLAPFSYYVKQSLTSVGALWIGLGILAAAVIAVIMIIKKHKK